MIIRPLRLTGDENDETFEDYKIGQGDKIKAKISRFTLAQLTVDAMKCTEIPSKVTF